MSKLVSTDGILKILSVGKGLKQKVELWLLNDQLTKNDWIYTNLEEHKDLFAETPILIAYVGNKIGDGHNFEEVLDMSGEIKASFISSTAERIVGFFKSAKDIRIENVNGQKWIVGTGYLWKWYAQELVDKLRKQGKEGMSISIETLVNDYYVNDEGYEVYTDYTILGTTILGDDVPPAVVGANIKALNSIGKQEVQKMTLRVASEQIRKKKTKEISKMFDGFTVLGQTGSTVALLSSEGKTCVYSMPDDNSINLDEVKEIKVNAMFDDVEVSLDNVVKPIVSKLNEEKEKLDKEVEETKGEKDKLNQELCDLKEENANLLKELEEFKAEKLERAKSDIKNAVSDRLCEIKERYDVEVEMFTDEKICEYAEMECSKDNALRDIDALCMQKLMECKNNNFNWDFSKAKSQPDDINSSIQRILK